MVLVYDETKLFYFNLLHGKAVLLFLSLDIFRTDFLLFASFTSSSMTVNSCFVLVLVVTVLAEGNPCISFLIYFAFVRIVLGFPHEQL